MMTDSIEQMSNKPSDQIRRESIQKIMRDFRLTPFEKQRSIQSLMDGRRRSSTASAGGMMAAAATAAEFYESSDDSDDDLQQANDWSGRPYPHTRRTASLTSFEGVTAAVAATIDNPDDNARKMELSRPRCTHYERQCTIISPCCGVAFGCRVCHDDCPWLPPPTQNGETKPARRQSLPLVFLEQEETHHPIDRKAIEEVICRKCFTRQGSKTNTCIKCHVQFGAYHCNVCNLWMSNEEEPYHCNDCGFCRVGGRDNFRHCHDCGMCIDVSVFRNHNCKAGKYQSWCPVCLKDLFSSREPSHEMSCGHAIHWHCFSELTSYDMFTRCPVCKKTAESAEEMQPVWSQLALSISLQPVPPELARLVNIVCIDCQEREDNRQWHFLGVQCRKCSSFNTSIDKITLIGPQAAAIAISTSQMEGNERENEHSAMTQGQSSSSDEGMEDS